MKLPTSSIKSISKIYDVNNAFKFKLWWKVKVLGLNFPTKLSNCQNFNFKRLLETRSHSDTSGSESPFSVILQIFKICRIIYIVM
jgi:hypothetical protein